MNQSKDSDAELVSLCVSGDKEAFRHIVERYQSLICGLAYSYCGDLARSQDHAQEVFITAWKQLPQLQDATKLKAWLCGIARNLLHNSLRRSSRDPIASAEPLTGAVELPEHPWDTPGDLVTQEEAAIMWRVLDGLPPLYREPLVLYYRQEQSTAAVAEALSTSEEVVRQRLSRGRALLNERVANFVAQTLRRSAPGKAFSLGVLAALPALATPAYAAVSAASAGKTAASAAASKLLIIPGAILGPLIGILGSYLGMRASLDATRTPREREFVRRAGWQSLGAALLFNVLLGVVILLALNGAPLALTVTFAIAVIVVFTASVFILAARHNHRFRQLRQEEQKQHPQLYASRPVVQFREHRSRYTFLGLPLFHFRSGNPPGEPPRPAIGWIAIGDRAVGVLFAAGAVAVGGISCGGAAAGIIALGGVGVGLIAIGGLTFGGLAMGGLGIGVYASAGIAVAWTAALGGLAVAKEFALGGLASAAHANDTLAREFFAARPWMDLSRPSVQPWMRTLSYAPGLLIVLFLINSYRKRKRHTRPSA